VARGGCAAAAGSVGLAAAIADGLGFLVILIWLVTDELPDDVDALGILLVAAGRGASRC
jgi:hypothetical protein